MREFSTFKYLNNLAVTKFKYNKLWQESYQILKVMVTSRSLQAIGRKLTDLDDKLLKKVRGCSVFEREAIPAKSFNNERKEIRFSHYDNYVYRHVKELTADEFASEIHELVNYLLNSTEN